MPLSFAPVGSEVSIKAMQGKDETCRFLAKLGFTIGGSVTVVTEINGNLIVKVKDSRVAISRGIANRILI